MFPALMALNRSVSCHGDWISWKTHTTGCFDCRSSLS